MQARQSFLLSLIVNDFVTNALKYVFADIEDPSLSIELTQEEGAIQMVFRDNGIGFESESVAPGFGLKMIRTLCGQLSAELGVQRGGGTVVCIRFDEE